jgi:hypothetical protein
MVGRSRGGPEHEKPMPAGQMLGAVPASILIEGLNLICLKA